MYLAPKPTAASFNEAVRDFKVSNPKLVLGDDSAVCFSFNDLAQSSSGKQIGDFSGYRDMLFEALGKLDVDDEGLTDSGKKNYRGLTTLIDVLKKCRGDKSIIVGFSGGSKALAQKDCAHLESRLSKWDNAGDNGVGSKIRGNWIQAEQFIKIVENIRSGRLRTDADIQRLASGVGDALRNNPKLTLGQIIERFWSDAVIPMDELSDDDLVKGIAGLAVLK